MAKSNAQIVAEVKDSNNKQQRLLLLIYETLEDIRKYDLEGRNRCVEELQDRRSDPGPHIHDII